MKYYLTLFETTAAYNAATLDLPNVSLIEENMNVTYNPYVAPETRLVAKFNVTDTSSPAQLCDSSAVSQFSDIEINGVVQPSVVSTYTFSTTGVHTVKYTLTDPTSIGEGAFQNCSNLTSIDIPNSVTSIGSSAFRNCGGLTSIDIPSGVTSIDYYVFSGCSSLTSCTIGSGVTSIGTYVFEDCSSLTSIISNTTTAPTITKYTFYNVNTDGTLTVPIGSSGYDTWMQNANYYLGYYDWTKIEQ